MVIPSCEHKQYVTECVICYDPPTNNLSKEAPASKDGWASKVVDALFQIHCYEHPVHGYIIANEDSKHIVAALLEAREDGRKAEKEVAQPQFFKLEMRYREKLNADEALLRGALEALEAANERLVQYCDAQDSMRLFWTLRQSITSITARLSSTPRTQGGESA